MQGRNEIIISDHDFIERFELNIEEIVEANGFGGHRCFLCDFDFLDYEGDLGPNCPKCRSRPRTRTLQVLTKIIEEIVPNGVAGSLLAFSKTGLEGKIIDPLFREVHSVSLFGEYSGKGHKTGVDVRKLEGYSDGSFSGVFGCLLFDYFLEHSDAISEISRVLAKGGLFLTHIAGKRLREGNQEPMQVGEVKAGEGSFEYLGSNRMASVSVGVDWFVKEMKKNGFLSCHVRIMDPLSGEEMIWFLGEKMD